MKTVNVRINYRNGGSEVRSIRTAHNLAPEGISRTLMSGGGTQIQSVEIVPATQRLTAPEPSGWTRTQGIHATYLD